MCKNFATCFLVTLIVFLSAKNVEMHSYNLGKCPEIEPQKDFDMSRMLGIWYVIAKTNTASYCIVYNITQTSLEPEEYQIEESSQHLLLAYGYHYKGTLRVPNREEPGRMTIQFPLSVAATFVVFMTDYDTYAGIFDCHKLPVAHRESAAILSRTRTLDVEYIDQIRGRLMRADISPYELSTIRQNDCPSNNTSGPKINDETLSAESAAGAIRNVGAKIKNGVEWLTDTVFGKPDKKGAQKIKDDIEHPQNTLKQVQDIEKDNE